MRIFIQYPYSASGGAIFSIPKGISITDVLRYGYNIIRAEV